MNILFLLLFFVLLLGANAYCFWHIWVLLPLSTPWRFAVITLLVVVALSSLAFYLLNGKDWSMGFASWTYRIGNSWLFVLLYAVLLFLLLDVLSLVGVVPVAWLRSNVVTAVILTASIALLFFYANHRFHDKQRVSLTLQTKKALTRPLKLVLLSDIHAGFHIRRDEVRKMVDNIIAEAPDYVLIAGDIIDISVRPLLEEKVAEEFRRLSMPVYAVLGNHEYLSGDTAALRFYAEAGISLLRDSVVVLPEGIAVVVRDDRMNPQRKNLQRLLKDQLPSAPNEGLVSDTPSTNPPFLLLLDHQPYHLEQAEKAGIDFQFSGHTHRGQVFPISWITDKLYECSWGQHQRGNTTYYISSGYGIWGAKFRLGTQSEYLVLHIQLE